MTSKEIKAIEDTRQYKVQLSARIEVLGQVFYPGNEVVLRGDTLRTVADKVSHADPL